MTKLLLVVLQDSHSTLLLMYRNFFAETTQLEGCVRKLNTSQDVIANKEKIFYTKYVSKKILPQEKIIMPEQTNNRLRIKRTNYLKGRSGHDFKRGFFQQKLYSTYNKYVASSVVYNKQDTKRDRASDLGSYHTTKINASPMRSPSKLICVMKQDEVKEVKKNILSDTIRITGIEVKKKTPTPNMSLIREAKKQILKELMDINQIPPSYFLLGRNSRNYNIDIDINDVADIVKIYTNQEGDIIIKPNEPSRIAQYLTSKKVCIQNSEAEACEDIMKIKRLRIDYGKIEKKCKVEGVVVPLFKKCIKRTLLPINSNKTRKHELTNDKALNVSEDSARKRVNHFHQVIASRLLIKEAAIMNSLSELMPVRGNIKIWHVFDGHLHNHKINYTFRLINAIVELLNSLKLDTTIEKQQRFYILCKKIDIGFVRRKIADPDFFKSKDNITAIKDKLLHHLYKTLNEDNEYKGKQVKLPKYFIGNGNNPVLVRTILKQRWWWAAAETIDNANLIWTQWRKSKIIRSLPKYNELEVEGKKWITNKRNLMKTTQVNSFIRVHNHMEGNGHLGNKKALFHNMKSYYEAINKDPFEAMPLTFSIRHRVGDAEYDKFLKAYYEFEKSKNTQSQNIWIIKPGENSNRGNGITVVKDLKEISKTLEAQSTNGTYILQKYIERPLLFNKRKFDIRCYGLLTAINGNVKGYFYKEGYLRTASKDFSLKLVNSRIIHLTNEAVQKNFEEFGKFEPGNKLSYTDLQKYLDTAFPDKNINFFSDLLPQIKSLVTNSFRAVHGKLDPKGRQYTFEIFGYDFMIDSNFHVYLIEANINPCLEVISPITARVIPTMLDNTLRIAVDPIFQPPIDLSITRKTTGEILPEIKHELIYDSKIDGEELEKLNSGIVELDDEENGESDNEFN